jgi:hypothetical protein
MKSPAAPFSLRRYAGVPFGDCKSIGSVVVVRSTKKWIKYRRFDRTIAHGKVVPCIRDGQLAHYVSVGCYNTIWA